MAAAAAGFPAWNATPVERRADILERAAELLEASRGRLIALMQSEGGKTLDDALSEVREAVDYCRYYAAEARRALAPQPMPGPTGESQRAALSRPRRVRLHQPVEFPAGDFSRPGHRRARRRQCRGGEARRADAADRRRSRAPAAPGRRAGERAASRAGRRQGRRGAGGRSARRRRCLHRLDRSRPRHQPRARRQGRPDRAADRRDRRHQRHDRRCHRAAGAGDRRRRHVGVPLRRPALLGAAAALRAGGRGRSHDRDDRRRRARACRSAIRAIRRPMSGR